MDFRALLADRIVPLFSTQVSADFALVFVILAANFFHNAVIPVIVEDSEWH